MAFTYDRVFVVTDENGKVNGVYMIESNAVASIPDKFRNFPREVEKFGAWEYGEGQKRWRMEERKVKDSTGIPSE